MRSFKLFIIAVIVMIAFSACKTKPEDVQTISTEMLKDKIAGGWAGKMIGVTYGAPTEFHALREIFKDSIKWTPADIKGSIWQDDLYVQLTFLMSMDTFGIDAPAKKFQEMFAKAGYPLWCANMQARKNYFDSIYPPASGSPEYNYRADDIDFQIEADYIGFMNPGMMQNVVDISCKIGHIMNYGDGVYGGIFMGAMYSAAYFENDIQKVVEKGLFALPAESDYAKIIRDVIMLHKQYPQDWKAAWKELDAKWGDVDISGAGSAFNIDAKLNGAYVVTGLLYGEGDAYKTLEITTRCGEDSDCNPSNAMAVLGVMRGFSNLPPEMQKGVKDMGDSIFSNTSYSYYSAVESTYKYAIQHIQKNGGEVKDNIITIPIQKITLPQLEISFPNVVFNNEFSIFSKDNWKFKGNWQVYKETPWDQQEAKDQAMFASKAGDEIEFSFEGTGVSLMGNWFKDGGKADVYLDGMFHRNIDTYYYYNKQEHTGVSIWHVFQLHPGKHSVKVVVKGEKKPESLGTNVYISQAVIYITAPKKSDSFRFSFEE